MEQHERKDHMPPRLYTKAEVKNLSRPEQARLACQLSVVPQFGIEEVGHVFGLKRRAVQYLFDEGRQAGHLDHNDVKSADWFVWGEEPSFESWQWFFEHYTLDELQRRYKGNLWHLIRKAGAESIMPREIADAEPKAAPQAQNRPMPMVDVFGQEIALRQMVTRFSDHKEDVVIMGTNVTIVCSDEHERQLVNAFVNLLDQRYEITSAGWDLCKHIIELYRDYDRFVRFQSESEQKSDTNIKQRADLIKAINAEIAKLPFEPKRTASDFDRFDRAIRRCMQYWAEHAHKIAVACRLCGQVEYVYLPFYQSLVQLRHECEQILASDDPPDQQAKLVLAEFERNPHFDPQLRDLGVAWSQPMVEWGKAMMFPAVGQVRRVTEHPDALAVFEREAGEPCEVLSISERPDGSQDVTLRWLYDGRDAEPQEYDHADVVKLTSAPLSWSAIADGLSAQFGVSPVCFDPVIPASPLNRVQRKGVDEFVVLNVDS